MLTLVHVTPLKVGCWKNSPTLLLQAAHVIVGIVSKETGAASVGN